LTTGALATTAPRRFRRQQLRSPLVSLLGLAAGAGIWQLIGAHTQESSFATFTETKRALGRMIENGSLPRALVQSLELFSVGLGIAIVLGFFGGLLLARVRLLGEGLEPYVAALYATPMVALIPFILATVGFDFRAKTIVVVLFGVFPVLINTLEGARSVNPELLEVSRSYRSNEARLWVHVFVPYTLPYTMTGVRQGIARALVGMIAAEFFFAAAGLGELILINVQRFNTAEVLGAVLTVTLLGVVLMAFGRAIENYFARWKAGV
jgi:NitT/TauT family transport system permease protein